MGKRTRGPVGWEDDPVAVGRRAHVGGDEVGAGCRLAGLLVWGDQGQLLQHWEEHLEAAHAVDHILRQTHTQ